MFQSMTYKGTLSEQYNLVTNQLKALIAGEPNTIANLANASSLLNQFLPDVNWVGFYLVEGEGLVLGPFQGMPACVRIPSGKGVCGTSLEKKQTIRVSNVHDFPGHIACDAASQSEIVIPLIVHGRIFAVLDIDSPQLNRFTEEEQIHLEQFVNELAKGIECSN
ncbi:GAF domain-containing protein [Halalkalibacter sp. APA_J-10(15)]|uniref:GAF domain-containing protein n=1 Tax=Halalkalibacter sp. APA_J-10(15) TaxID=2933805 RepID=UPI002366AB68|nr:GAF domain-containing protein [Halalkalibacter sp. APA_J-10(15)]